MKYLITGGAGFIGTKLVERIIKNKSNEIYIIDDFSKKTENTNIVKLLKNKNIKLINKDLNQISNYLKVYNFDYIYHFAAILGVQKVIENPLRTLRDNIQTTINLINFSKKQKNLKIICFTSTSEVYAYTLRKKLAKYPTPEVQKSDLTENMLDLMRLKYINNVKDLKVLLNEFITPPSDKFVNSSLRTLQHLHAISSDNNDGIMTSLGKAITQFRGVKPQFSRTIIYSHFYKCSREICDIIAISIISDGRMNMIFEEFKPDKKKADGVNKKAEKEYNQIRKSMTHKLGDYMTCYTAYQTYLNRTFHRIDHPTHLLMHWHELHLPRK